MQEEVFGFSIVKSSNGHGIRRVRGSFSFSFPLHCLQVATSFLHHHFGIPKKMEGKKYGCPNNGLAFGFNAIFFCILFLSTECSSFVVRCLT